MYLLSTIIPFDQAFTRISIRMDYYSKGYSNSKPNQQGTTNYGNSYKENNAQSAASSYYNGSASKGSSTGRMPEQQNSDHQYYISSMSSNHGQQGGGGAENSTYTSKSIRTKKFPSLNG
ncbi:hypothetical protein DAI22_08g123500 [Oryza sativa Japonica Group]|nr:uncharacterized protein LOC112936186 [Oryza sativa Japonica Group]KAF2919289.1 hypothetical protein DAI22_08g123500 [Oryza sativa Japonica Group]